MKKSIKLNNQEIAFVGGGCANCRYNRCCLVGHVLLFSVITFPLLSLSLLSINYTFIDIPVLEKNIEKYKIQLNNNFNSTTSRDGGLSLPSTTN